MKRYRVSGSISTRASDDPKSPDYEAWLRWDDGDVLTDAPAHLPTADLVKSGHLTPITKERSRPSALPTGPSSA